MIARKNIIKGVFVMLCLYLFIGKTYALKSNYRILIRATLNNSDYIIKNDSLFKFENCIKYTIDTINIKQIKKKNKDKFIYKNKEYYYSQLLKLNEFNINSSVYIKSFVLTSSFKEEIVTLKNEDACFSYFIKDKFIEYLSSFYKDHKKHGKIYIESIYALYGKKKIKLNNIVIDLYGNS